MTPEQQAQLQEVYEFVSQRKNQQILFPLDESSKNALGAAIGNGTGNSTLTTSISIGAGGGSATVPIGYGGSFILKVDGINYEIGYIRTI